MNRSLAFGMLIGLAGGLIAGALIAKSKAPVTPSPVVAPPPPPPPIVLSPAPDPEVAGLRAEVTELKAKLAAANKPPPPPSSPGTSEADAAKPGWKEKLDELLKKGVTEYQGEAFHAMLAELKKLGKEGIDKLADRLLHAETGGERFLAAALLEELGDPSAIPALAQALQKDEDLLVRRMSSHAIAMIKNETGLPSLRTAMNSDSDWGVRVNSAYGVAKLGQADGVKMLEDAYNSTTTPAEYRLAVLGGLADVAAKSSAPIFKKILTESTDISALFVTIGAVQKMGDPAFVQDLNRIAGDAKYAANIREMAKKAADALAK
ncbi:MAG TPA: HEAT repeat domain-containing protein [Planctomycetota bacterium]|nr:HEAT repeat domain-containing protein [Planctomycetota bacterium]